MIVAGHHQPQDGCRAMKLLYEQMAVAQVRHRHGLVRGQRRPVLVGLQRRQRRRLVIPVDIYLPGCPPRPESLFDALLTLMERNQGGEPSAAERWALESALVTVAPDTATDRRAFFEGLAGVADVAAARTGRSCRARRTTRGALLRRRAQRSRTSAASAPRAADRRRQPSRRLGGLEMSTPSRAEPTRRWPRSECCWPDDATCRAPSLDDLWPGAGAARARGLRPVRRAVRRPPGPQADRAARRLRRPPAAQVVRDHPSGVSREQVAEAVAGHGLSCRKLGRHARGADRCRRASPAPLRGGRRCPATRHCTPSGSSSTWARSTRACTACSTSASRSRARSSTGAEISHGYLHRCIEKLCETRIYRPASR